VIVNLSGRGDKDVETAAAWFDMLDEDGNVKGTTFSTRKPKGPAERTAGAGADDVKEDKN